MAIEKYQREYDDPVVESSNRLIKNIRKLIKRQEHDINERKGDRKNQKVLSTNIKEMVRQQKETNRLQLRTMFSKKETGFDLLKEQLLDTNEILEQIRKGKKLNIDGSGIFSNIGNFFSKFTKNLKDGLLEKAPLIAGALGSALAAAFTYKQFEKLGSEIMNWIQDGLEAERVGKAVQQGLTTAITTRSKEKEKRGEFTTQDTENQIKARKLIEKLNVERYGRSNKKQSALKELIGEMPLIGDLIKNTGRFKTAEEMGLFEGKGKTVIVKGQKFEIPLTQKEKEKIVDEFIKQQSNVMGTRFREDYVPGSIPDSTTKEKKEELISKNIKLNLDQNFVNEVRKMSNRLGIPVDTLMGIMDFETGGTFNPAEPAKASSAVGLIQFMPKTAKGLGTSSEELSKMSQSEQLKYVEKYFKEQMKRGDIKTLSDAYMAVLNPSMIGKAEDTPIFKQGTKEYKANVPLDFNKDGIITKQEATLKVANRVKKYASLEQNNLANAPIGEIKAKTDGIESALERFLRILNDSIKDIGKDVANNMPKQKAPQFIVSNDARR